MSISKPNRIIVIEDDQGYVDVLEEVFMTVADVNLVAAYRDPLQFLSARGQVEPDVVLLDINLPRLSGLECISKIREAFPKCRIVMLTVLYDDKSVLQAFLNGADGYLVKDSSRGELICGVRESLSGGAPMSTGIARKVIRLLAKLGNGGNGQSESVRDLLSPREYEVLNLLAAGEKYQEVADKLCVSYETVKTHIHHIYEKLQVRNKAEAISKFLG